MGNGGEEKEGKMSMRSLREEGGGKETRESNRLIHTLTHRGKIKNLFCITSALCVQACVSVKVLFLVVNCSFLSFQVSRA